MAKAGITEYKEDQIILKQGDPDKSLYKILSGQVAVYINYEKDDEYLVGIQTYPNCFGEMTILSGQPSFYTVVALTDTKILCVPEENFESFIQSNPANAISIMKTMAKNISLLNMNIKMLNEEINYNNADGGINAASGNGVVLEETTITFSGNVANDLFLPGHKVYDSYKCIASDKFTYLKEYVCPHCGTKFVTLCINGTAVDNNVERKSLDRELRVDCGKFHIEWYQVVTCTHCYFSAMSDFFKKTGVYVRKHKYDDDLKRAFSNLFLNFTAERDLEFVFAQYYLALICVKGTQDETLMESRLWLNLSRLYEDVNEKELSAEAAKRAGKCYINDHYMSTLKHKLEHKICMSIAEILYKNACYEEARELAVFLLMERADSNYYTRMAEDMIADIRDKGVTE